MQLYLLLIPRPIRNGASIKDGMLIRMKKVWNGARTAIVVPTL